MFKSTMFFLALCSLWLKKDERSTFRWQTINNDSSQVIEKPKGKGDNLTVPALWVEVSEKSIDSLINVGIQYENIESENKYPNLIVNGQPLMNYGWREKVDVNGCSYEVFTFEAMKGDNFNPDDLYWLYYIKGIGFISAEDRFYDNQPYLRYDLIECTDKHGKPMLNTDNLRQIMPTLKKNRYRK